MVTTAKSDMKGESLPYVARLAPWERVFSALGTLLLLVGTVTAATEWVRLRNELSGRESEKKAWQQREMVC
jgi:hypothetical protein